MLNVIRFFNGGDKFADKFMYTKPDTDFKVENGIAYWQVDAPKEGFFEVPYEIEVGEGTFRLGVYAEVTHRYGERGVIRVEPNAKKALEENANDPRYKYVAIDDESARIKGKEIWREYLRRIIDDFEAENQRRVTERGLAPLRPNNFVAHAYDVLGLKSAAEEKYSTAALHKSEVDTLKEKLAEQERVNAENSRMLQQLIANQQREIPQATADPVSTGETASAGTAPTKQHGKGK